LHDGLYHAAGAADYPERIRSRRENRFALRFGGYIRHRSGESSFRHDRRPIPDKTHYSDGWNNYSRNESALRYNAQYFDSNRSPFHPGNFYPVVDYVHRGLSVTKPAR